MFKQTGMRKYVLWGLLLVSMFGSQHAIAEEGKLKLGLGTYMLVVPMIGIVAETYAGEALVVDYVWDDFWSVNMHTYALTHDTLTHIKVDGWDVNIHVGLKGEGFNVFTGLGFYKETGAVAPVVAVSGLQFSSGLGYAWSHASVAWDMQLRSTSNYENAGLYVSSVAFLSGIKTAYRF